MRRQLVGQCISIGLHAFVLVVLVLIRAEPAVETPEIQIEFVSAGTPDQMLPPDSTAPEAGFDAALLRLDQLRIDVARIRSRVGVLFPFLTLDLMFLERVPRDLDRARQTLVNPYGRAASQEADLPPLPITDALMQKVIDGAWSRRERWRTFQEIVTLVSKNSPFRGGAPDLLRGYLDQNILQPYCDGHTLDSRYWAMLENAADHADFIDFVRSFARRYPSSRTTTELLFLLDELAQGSRDSLLMITETQPAPDLALTRAVSPDAYALAVEIQERYGRWLFEHDFDVEGIRRHYHDLRLRLLTTIIHTTQDGYRERDARFLAGQVLFETNRLDDAVRMWRSAIPRDGDAYFRAYSEILAVLDAGPPERRSLARVIANEYGRWRVFSIDRLRGFGFKCDTF